MEKLETRSKAGRHMRAKGFMNSQSLPRFPRTNSLKERKIGVKILHNNLGYITLA